MNITPRQFWLFLKNIIFDIFREEAEDAEFEAIEEEEDETSE